ncbi:MAG: HDIG domain-containing metalloprotein [Candidatus Eisenbacteria bacterium]|nr:HDIG domain-containing protein [Candidatus Eisenbacteria bacterium]
MSAGIDREKALALLRQHVADPRILKHSLASEAVLRALAARLGEDPDVWGIAGLLHDIDIEITQADPAVHGSRSAPILEANGVEPEVVAAIRRHNRLSTTEPRQSRLDHALAAGETITGLIVSTALILPDKKLASVKAKSVAKRIKDDRFASSVNRETIRECEEIGIDTAEFAGIALVAMQGVSDELDL